MLTRRDFLDGVALTIASGLTPAAQIFAQPARYPPALTGLRGDHPGSFETAHALAREGTAFPVDDLAVEDSYDLVIVGGGISGLAAAWFYRRAVGPQARILILDNHDDFGGHAKRNEFTLAGRRIIGYGGSESMQSPKTLYSPVAKDLVRELGIDLARFETAFDRNLYGSLGLSRGLFFSRDAFGRDALVVGDATRFGGTSRQGPDAKPISELIARYPVSEASKTQLLELYESTRDPLPDRSVEAKRRILKSTSYRDYLIKICGLSEEAADCFQGRTLGFFGVGCDAVAAADVRDFGYPGFQGLGLPEDKNPAWEEPYIYHFPDGNAALARLLVRALIPGVAPGETMEDIAEAPFDYGRLDTDGNVRIRLDATCVSVRETPGQVLVGYVRDGRVHKVAARQAVLACFHAMIPYLMPQLPAAQRAALARNVRTPLVYTNVLVRDWRPWVALGVSAISAPMSFHCNVKLDFPVSLGGYRCARDPSEPICLHLVHVPSAPNQGLDAREQFRVGRQSLLSMTFADFEDRMRDELDRMLGPGGFVSGRDIAAITVNRWAHGYAYTASSLFDGDDWRDTMRLARRNTARVAIANSDAGWDAYAHVAIDQADRAVHELLH
jgi:spermidine dehydrogenase